MTDHTLAAAIEKVRWASVAGLNHPTSCSQYWRQPDGGEPFCDCGLWDALEHLTRSRFGLLLREWEQGKKPR